MQEQDTVHQHSGEIQECIIDDIESQTTGNDARISQQTIDEPSSYGDTENRPPCGSHDLDSLLRLAGVPAPKTVTFGGELGRTRGHGSKGQSGKGNWESAKHGIRTDVPGEWFDEYSGDMQMRSGKIESRRKLSQKEKEHLKMTQARTIPELHPGVQVEENKRRVHVF